MQNYPKKFLSKLICFYQNYKSNFNVYYVVEPYDWAIKYVGVKIKEGIKGVSLRLTTEIAFIRNSIVHFGSINTLIINDRLTIPHQSNKVIVTCFHLEDNDKRNILIQRADVFVKLWVTSCSLTKEKLKKLGIRNDKIIVIHLGIDLNLFKRYSPLIKNKIKDRYCIPKDKFIIGSFQKDGDGWSDGDIPKYVKGPDILCKVLLKISLKYDIFVLLSGPSRGYVKNFLTQNGIPFFHKYFKNQVGIAEFYNACDLYLMTSRVEGGPMSILESWATGTPLIATNVGIVPDIVKNEINGLVVKVNDINSMVKKIEWLFENKRESIKITNQALEDAKEFSWKKISDIYRQQLYK
jgi:glycosyltransferase involved in cell wall biosynthesis